MHTQSFFLSRFVFPTAAFAILSACAADVDAAHVRSTEEALSESSLANAHRLDGVRATVGAALFPAPGNAYASVAPISVTLKLNEAAVLPLQTVGAQAGLMLSVDAITRATRFSGAFDLLVQIRRVNANVVLPAAGRTFALSQTIFAAFDSESVEASSSPETAQVAAALSQANAPQERL